MKMVPAIFWGSLLMVIGITIIINVVFKVEIPVFRIILAFVFIFIGIKLLLGKNVKVIGHQSVQNKEQNFTAGNTDNQEYNIVFSKGMVDLRSIDFPDGKPIKVRINAVFGNAEIMLSRDIPLKVTSNTAFASVNIPDGNTVVVGSSNYQSDNFDGSKPYIDLKMDVVFANAKLLFY